MAYTKQKLRLTDGKMVFLNNLKFFLGRHSSAKKIKTRTFNNKKVNQKKSIFKFSKEKSKN